MIFFCKTHIEYQSHRFFLDALLHYEQIEMESYLKRYKFYPFPRRQYFADAVFQKNRGDF